MSDNRILMAFLEGQCPAGEDVYRVTPMSHNPLVRRKDGGYGMTEACYWLVGAGSCAVVAVYSVNRKTVLVNTRHNLSEEVCQVLDEMGHWQTALVDLGDEANYTVKLFCPIACEDCEQAMSCGTASEEARCRMAAPREISVGDGPLFF